MQVGLLTVSIWKMKLKYTKESWYDVSRRKSHYFGSLEDKAFHQMLYILYRCFPWNYLRKSIIYLYSLKRHFWVTSKKKGGRFVCVCVDLLWIFLVQLLLIGEFFFLVLFFPSMVRTAQNFNLNSNSSWNSLKWIFCIQILTNEQINLQPWIQLIHNQKQNIFSQILITYCGIFPTYFHWKFIPSLFLFRIQTNRKTE